MESKLTSADTAAICKHMNDDHADAIAGYARAYGRIERVTAAEMLAMDGQSMELGVDTADGRIVTRIDFDHVIADSADARDTLIKMARQASAAD